MSICPSPTMPWPMHLTAIIRCCCCYFFTRILFNFPLLYIFQSVKMYLIIGIEWRAREKICAPATLFSYYFTGCVYLSCICIACEYPIWRTLRIFFCFVSFSLFLFLYMCFIIIFNMWPREWRTQKNSGERGEREKKKISIHIKTIRSIDFSAIARDIFVMAHTWTAHTHTQNGELCACSHNIVPDIPYEKYQLTQKIKIDINI